MDEGVDIEVAEGNKAYCTVSIHLRNVLDFQWHCMRIPNKGITSRHYALAAMAGKGIVWSPATHFQGFRETR